MKYKVRELVSYMTERLLHDVTPVCKHVSSYTLLTDLFQPLDQIHLVTFYWTEVEQSVKRQVFVQILSEQPLELQKASVLEKPWQKEKYKKQTYQ